MFFREICASEVNVEKLRHLEASMPITLCKLEMEFPLRLFDSMEHFPVHLAYEAKVGGFYAYLSTRLKIKGMLKDLSLKRNQRYVEGSIAEAYLVEETTKFASYYYLLELISRWRGVPRNDDSSDTSAQISIFNFPGRVMGKHFDGNPYFLYFSNGTKDSISKLVSDLNSSKLEPDVAQNKNWRTWSFVLKGLKNRCLVAASTHVWSALSLPRSLWLKSISQKNKNPMPMRELIMNSLWRRSEEYKRSGGKLETKLVIRKKTHIFIE
ncbi:hypothetical protein K1719_026544 [Acacia pycnantha]|nr:hypothetical protein K1719_026544 [Acacia pycnantha]